MATIDTSSEKKDSNGRYHSYKAWVDRNREKLRKKARERYYMMKALKEMANYDLFYKSPVVEPKVKKKPGRAPNPALKDSDGVYKSHRNWFVKNKQKTLDYAERYRAWKKVTIELYGYAEAYGF